MEYLLLCVLLQGTVRGASLFDLEISVNGIKSILEREQETIRQLKLEVSGLKKELVISQKRSGSLNSIDELTEKLAVLSSNLDILNSGQEAEKVERHGILADLVQIKQWTTDLITDTERGWKNAIANFSTGNRDKQRDYEGFKTQASDEWDQWQDKAKETLSGIEAGFKKANTDFQRQQTELESRINGLGKAINCFKDCETGWVKDGCSCYSSLNNPPLPYDVAINKCAASGARLIQPREITKNTFFGFRFMWAGVSHDIDQPWRYPNGTEAKGFFTVRTFKTMKRQCGIARIMTGTIISFSVGCNSTYNFICVKN